MVQRLHKASLLFLGFEGGFRELPLPQWVWVDFKEGRILGNSSSLPVNWYTVCNNDTSNMLLFKDYIWLEFTQFKLRVHI